MIRFDASSLPGDLALRAGETFEELRRRFARWAEEVGRALAALPRFDVRHLRWAGGQTGIDVATAFRTEAVLLGGVRFVSGGAAVGAGVTVDWAVTDTGYRLRSIDGLASGTEYTITLVAMGAD